jgi:MtN3 and saliva related transmembrane protein
VSFVPQVWHILKTRDTRALSLMMYLLFTVGIVLWLVYGVMIGSTPVIVANSITLVLALVILICKVRWG